MSNLAIDAIFDHAIEQLDRERSRLLSGDAVSTAAGQPKFDHDGFYAVSRAVSYVVMGGVLEELMRNLPSALASDITTMGVERRHLPVSLVAATDAETFRKCGNDTVTSLIERAAIVKIVLDHEKDARPVVDFGELFKLADGHTINDRHFRAIWMILGLDGDWKNHPNDMLLLREIREKRNDVAHWTEDPVVIGRSKRSSDLTAMIARLSDLIQHFQLNVWYWLEARKTNMASGTSTR
jgi:hypothetical protein